MLSGHTLRARACPAASWAKPGSRNHWQVHCYCQVRTVAFSHVACTDDKQRRAAASRVLRLVADRPATTIEDRHMREALLFHQSLTLVRGWQSLERQLKRQQHVARTGPVVLQRALSSQRIRVPDVEGAAASRCSLTIRPFGQRFRDNSLNSFLVQLFFAISKCQQSKVTLSRFDLFHGHLFVTRVRPHSIGLLFHAMEYPAKDADFQIDLGYCQQGSLLTFKQQPWDNRNWLFYKGNLVSIDLSEGSILNELLLMSGLRAMRTTLESDFGHPLCDVNFFAKLQAVSEIDKLFVCPLKDGNRHGSKDQSLLSKSS